MVDGLALGDNTKAALMTRGLAEISRLGIAMGAKQETISGLSGIGDLIVTCTSEHSRNHTAGYLMGKGYTPDEAMKEVKQVVEGYFMIALLTEVSGNLLSGYMTYLLKLVMYVIVAAIGIKIGITLRKNKDKKESMESNDR